MKVQIVLAKPPLLYEVTAAEETCPRVGDSDRETMCGTARHGTLWHGATA